MRFSAGLFAVGSADLGKRRRWVAFQADSTCETAQKFADGARESLGERGGTVVSKNAAFDKQYRLVAMGQIRTSRASRNGSGMAAKKGKDCRYAP